MHLENLFLNPAYLAAFLFRLKISAVFNMNCVQTAKCFLTSPIKALRPNESSQKNKPRFNRELTEKNNQK